MGRHHVLSMVEGARTGPQTRQDTPVKVSNSVSLYHKALAHPFIYEKVRPRIVGGIDMSPLFKLLEAGPHDTVLDIGAGTGMALEYLPKVHEYYGFDTDALAIEYALRRPEAKRGGVNFDVSRVDAADFKRIRPTRVIFSGILHHLSDQEVADLLNLCEKCDSVIRVATSDPVFVPGAFINNLFCRLDRGNHVRTIEDQLELIKSTRLHLDDITVTRSHPQRGRAIYLMTGLERFG